MKEFKLYIVVALLTTVTGCSRVPGYLNINGENIASVAEQYEGSTDWAYDKRKDSFPAKPWKCNKFVHDILEETGATTPSYGAWPIVAADWANPNYPYSWLETRGLWSCSATGGRDCDHKD
jgi:hypothetical protein